MTALFIPRFAKEKSIILILFLLIVWVYPEISLGASLQSKEQNQPLVFEVKNPILNSQTDNQGLKLDEIAENDPLVNNLKIYLEKHRSPLAEYAEEIVLQEDWQKALAISWVESNFGKYCFDENCSGIGVKPGHPSWRKYPNKLAWFKDLSQLLQKPIYKDRFNTCRKMKGVYVQPGSEKWVRGCEQKLNELTKLAKESEKQRQLIAQKQTEKIALATFTQTQYVE